MKLYLLSMTKDGRKAYSCTYDYYDSFVIRAKSQKEARSMAYAKATTREQDMWLESKHSVCKEVTSKGDSVILAASFNAG